MSTQLPMRFDGPDYRPRLDRERLTWQYASIRDLMADGRWRTLTEIERATGYPQSSISAQLRNLRKARFGGHTVNRRRCGMPEDGLYEYQLIVNGGGND